MMSSVSFFFAALFFLLFFRVHCSLLRMHPLFSLKFMRLPLSSYGRILAYKEGLFKEYPHSIYTFFRALTEILVYIVFEVESWLHQDWQKP